MRAVVGPFWRAFGVAAPALCCALLPGCGQGESTEQPGFSEQRVIGGDPSPPSQNAVVAIIDTQNVWATGVVVAPTLVLTARHFLYSVNAPSHVQCGSDRSGAPISMANDARKYTVLFGNQKSLTPVAQGVEIHGGSELDLCRNDIALLEVDTPLPVTPLALRLDAPPQQGELGTLVGWGQSAENEPLGLGVRRLQRDLAVTAVGPTLLALENGGMLKVDSAAFVTEEGGCFGDSGAPFISTATGAVVGVLSMAEPSDPTLLSQSPDFSECVGAHDVFGSLVAQRDWISDEFARTGQAPWLEGLAQPAATGQSCQSNAECISGQCASAGDTHFCTVSCASGPCPDDLQCVGAPDARICVPRALSKAQPASHSCSVAGFGPQPPCMSLLIPPFVLALRRRHHGRGLRKRNP